MYDLLCTAIYETHRHHLDVELSQPMGNPMTLASLTSDNIVIFATQLGLPAKLSLSLLYSMLGKIEMHADVLIKQVEELADIPHKAGELRMLREIRYKLIAEMVALLKAN